MCLPVYPFGCQSNSALWTKCLYSVEDYSINISIKLLSIHEACSEIIEAFAFYSEHIDVGKQNSA